MGSPITNEQTLWYGKPTDTKPQQSVNCVRIS